MPARPGTGDVERRERRYHGIMLRDRVRPGFRWVLLGTLLLLVVLGLANQILGRPIGAPCPDSYACRWGLPGGVECVDVDGDSYCTTYCKSDETCPKGWRCREATPTVLTAETKATDRVCVRPPQH